MGASSPAELFIMPSRSERNRWVWVVGIGMVNSLSALSQYKALG